MNEPLADDSIDDQTGIEIGGELNRIFGSEATEKFFWLLPFETPVKMLEFLRTLPSNLSVAGFQEALEKHFGHPQKSDQPSREC